MYLLPVRLQLDGHSMQWLGREGDRARERKREREREREREITKERERWRERDRKRENCLEIVKFNFNTKIL